MIIEPSRVRDLTHWEIRLEEARLRPLDPQPPHKLARRAAQVVSNRPDEVNRVHPHLGCHAPHGYRTEKVGSEELFGPLVPPASFSDRGAARPQLAKDCEPEAFDR